MLNPLLALCLLTAQAGEIYSTVKKESTALLSCITKEKCGDSSVYLDIPWNEPSFQFWRSYYRNRWNRLKLFSYVDNFKLFYPTVKKIFKEEGLPEDLALLAVVESNGNPDAVSKAGAAGLWQLMPATARKYGLKVNRYIDERFDLEKST
ncbi:MAG: transglycosylase SLT domain-containing protein, partial [Desulfurobacteriaceae bacterium]